MKRVNPITKLREAMPDQYIKRTHDHLCCEVSNGLIYAVANGLRKNPTVQEALAWVAIENLLTKLFNK